MTTQERLNAYLATESEILAAQELRHGDRTFRLAELNEVRRAIKDLERQRARELAGGRMRFSVANLSGS
jgi:hypothetical protein